MAKTANERLAAEAVRHRLMLLRYGNHHSQVLIKLLRAGNTKIIAQLLKSVEGLNVATMTTARLRRISNELIVVVQDVYLTLFNESLAEMESFARYEVAYQAETLRSVVPAPIQEAKPDLIQDVAIAGILALLTKTPVQGYTMKVWFEQQLPQAMVKMAVNQVQASISQGATPEEAVINVRKSQMQAAAERNVATVAHTAIGNAAATIRQESVSENKALIKARQWLSTLDNHTTVMCITRDHELYTVSQPVEPLRKGAPPYGAGPGKLHFRCRSVEIPVLKSWDQLGFAEGDLDGKTRASMDGEVPAGMNYREWLQNRASPDVQEEVLGITRADMLRTGKFKVSDFFDDGKLIPLNELIAKDKAQRL